MPPLNTLSRTSLALAISQAIASTSLAAEIEVNTSGDADPVDGCTLRQAIVSANTGLAGSSNCIAGTAGLDTITFAPAVFPLSSNNTITLLSSLPHITTDMSITGQGTQGITIDANSTGRVFRINDSAIVNLDNLTITGGSAYRGGGIYAHFHNLVTLSNSTVSGNSSSDSGGGIELRGLSTLNLSNSSVSGNSATTDGGGIYIRNTSMANINDSTISNNTSDNSGGGIGLFGASSANLSNSTLSGNSAARGGGIYFFSSSSANLSNSTVSGNSTSITGGGIYIFAMSSISLSNSTVTGNSAVAGGGVSAHTSYFDFKNSIIAGNSALSFAAEIKTNAAVVYLSSNNLLGDSSHTNAEAFTNFSPGGMDITATSDGSQATTLSSILSPLTNNGGATQTHALRELSPAIDTGNNAVCAAAPINNLDQRGEMRPVGNACDIGAYEFKDGSQFFVVPLPKGKVVTFVL